MTISEDFYRFSPAFQAIQIFEKPAVVPDGLPRHVCQR